MAQIFRYSKFGILHNHEFSSSCTTPMSCDYHMIVTVLEKKDHLDKKIIFELVTPRKGPF